MSSLIKLQGPRTSTLLKREFNTGFFQWILWIIQKHLFCVEDLWTAGSETPVCPFLRTSFFTEHLQWLLLSVSGFQPATLLKKRLQQRHFLWILQNFSEHLLTEHLRVTASCVYIWILRSFSDHLIYRAPLGNCLFHVQVAEFQPPDTIKSTSQVLFKHFIQK